MLILIIAFLFIACGDDVNRQVRKAYSVNAILPDSLKANEDYTLTIFYIMPDPCYKFHELEYKRTANVHDFSVWLINENTAAMCPEVLIKDSLTKVINLSSKGLHTFRFYSFGDSLIKDVVVN